MAFGGNLKIDQLPVINYETPTQRGGVWRTYVKWTVPIGCGGAAGWLLSFSGYGAICFGIVAGFMVATLSAAFAQRQRLAFGLLGNGCTILACMVFTVANNVPAITTRELLLLGLVITAIVVVPGLLGIASVYAFHSVTRPKTRFE